jgi:YbbR domain-containing protein
VRESTVLVQVSVAAIEGSMTITAPVEVIGLSPDLIATISPETVDIIIAGPLNILEKLDPNSIRVVLDLTGLPPGVYRRSPVVEQLPAQVRVQTTLPETVEAAISLAPTPTIIITGTLTLTPTVTPLISP